MGQLVNGTWHDRWYDTEKSGGKFVREDAQLRNWITADGAPGPTGIGGFAAEADRYHLYVSLACPWAHRTLIFRHLKDLGPLIGVSVVSPDMLEHGWTFDRAAGSTGDALHGFEYLHQVYTLNHPTYSGRVTVPVLWDKHQRRIVSNESSEIIRMFNQAFDHITGNTADMYPLALRTEIDQINSLVYADINNGVYRCGFATSQSAYESAFFRLHEALDHVESILTKRRFLVGETATEADWRLFTTLIRFDAVYHGHFKCNRQRIEDSPALARYLRTLYQWPGIAETVDFEQIKRHYYYSHAMLNPTRVVPVGPHIDYRQPAVPHATTSQ